eukprot:gene30304-36616_t
MAGVGRLGAYRSVMTMFSSPSPWSTYGTRVIAPYCPSKLYMSDSPVINSLSQEETKTGSLPPGALRLKVRQHVNPLSSTYQKPLELSSTWLKDAYPDPKLPLVLDIGCAKGSWVLDMAAQHSHMNFLGLEIRRPVVELCMRRKQHRKIANAHFLPSNANVDLETLLQSLHSQHVDIQCVTIQFPDPHFKLKHRKRRVVNEQLVNLLAKKLVPGCKVFFQTDIEELAYDMWGHFAQLPQYFEIGEGNINTIPGTTTARTWDPSRLDQNLSIFPVQTEREIATLNKGGQVFRMCVVRSKLPHSVA